MRVRKEHTGQRSEPHARRRSPRGPLGEANRPTTRSDVRRRGSRSGATIGSDAAQRKGNKDRQDGVVQAGFLARAYGPKFF